MAVVATVAAAAVLRAIGLNSGLWFDEIVTLVESARLPIASILTEFPGVNAHPLYSVLAHASLESFGESAWALRLPAVVFGVASVAAAYALGARVIGRAEALAGAAVLAASYHHIWFSQNARGYTMLGFFALISTLALVRAGDRGQTRDYVVYALVSAAGVYTHLTMVFVVAGQFVVLAGGWAAGWRRAASVPFAPLVWSWIAAVALSMIAYAPFIPALLNHFGSPAPRQAAEVATGGWAIGEALRAIVFGAGVPGALLSGAVAVVGFVSLIRRAPLVTMLLVMPAIVTAGALAVLGQPIRPRFFFYLSGAAALFVGRGLGAIPGFFFRSSTPGFISAGAAVLILASAVALPRNYRLPKQDFAGAVRFLEQEEALGARIAAAGPACLPVNQYYGKAAWPCLATSEDLTAFAEPRSLGLVVHTLTDYVDDPALGMRLKSMCAQVARFPGTLGGGDLVICDPKRQEAP